VTIRRVEDARDPLLAAVADRPRPARLTDEQTVAVGEINAALESRAGRSFLLEGVTGSGKTEVYLAAIERALALGRSAIVLVPEIALTPQTVGWFRARFEQVAVLHSRMTDAQRLDTWLTLARGEARVVVGARSAIFAPLADLGDRRRRREHEPSFKQSNAPRYHARDVALERATLSGAVCVLGSATPSLESWSRARGTPRHLRLTARTGGRRCRRSRCSTCATSAWRGPSRFFSLRLRDLLERTLARASRRSCSRTAAASRRSCGARAARRRVRCKRCDVALVSTSASRAWCATPAARRRCRRRSARRARSRGCATSAPARSASRARSRAAAEGARAAHGLGHDAPARGLRGDAVGVRPRRDRRARRHADDRQGPRFPARDAGRHRQRGRRAAPARFPRRRSARSS
jgi:primosomal protein N'